MFGKISSIKLHSDNNTSYWIITIIDENGYEIGTFGDMHNGDSSNFRKQTFGIMQICNCMDLFKMSGKDLQVPILVDAMPTRIGTLCNENGDYLSIDENANITIGSDFDTKKCEMGKLVGLESSSGIMSAKIIKDFSLQYFQAPMAYRGFKEIYDFPVSDEEEKKGAEYFKSFVLGIMDICHITDLINGTDNLPIVSICVDSENQIRAIGNSNESIWLVGGENYSISKEPPNLKKGIVK